ncbi:mannose-1-phosphate guanylyltransferase [Rhodocaloribacter litoris]|uniref:mannose-1-phosphate guanylyltransferase n=1 Tax=Rhodocaloribacter litoris TaxID=2558931 RepID=UPI001421D5FA|nr:mannose-1-phosphate guanylyltransferase [Rhodocaloribacter litoris]QXD14297.1 mannose-1-phosphate guanylyltransferase [Rhodocaloribacter litoris]GIV60696.1 MAG: mannose-1-phosphate guanylyltransferase [Rhodothermaceae bacterium]
MSTYAIIMAGGIGSRFWPKSRLDHPKQFLRVFGDSTLIQNTVARLQGLIPPERCYVVTHERYVERTKAQLPAVPAENILAEPISRNTAPCIAYAAVRLLARDPDATMVVLPADHVITDVRKFHTVLRTAIETAQEPGALVTIGITPTYPATGYGYIQFEGSLDQLDEQPRALRVRTFAEKPDTETAERFIDSGDFLWNSGIFVWRADAIRDQMATHLPKVFQAFEPVAEAVGTEREREVVAAAFQNSPRISIDYGVMERAGKVYVVPASFGWSDVGDWRAVYELSEKDEHGNALQGNVIVHDASRCLVQSDDRLVVLIGLHDTVVIDTEDAVLVCHRESAQQVKNVVDYLYAHQLTRYI